MDNPFLAAFLGCAFALLLAGLVVFTWIRRKVGAITDAMPESIRRAGDVQSEFVVRELHQQMGGMPSPVVVPPIPPIPSIPLCRQVDCRQLSGEGPGRDAAWVVECHCGWASYATTRDDAMERFASHRPLLIHRPAPGDTESNIKGGLDCFAAECEVFVVFARLGDRDPHGPDDPRKFAVVGQHVDDRQLRDAVRGWLEMAPSAPSAPTASLRTVSVAEVTRPGAGAPGE